MKIVVDSNIVFSCILNTKSNLGQIILNGSNYFDFYSINLLQNEIFEHKDKIQKISKLDDNQFVTTYRLIISKIRFVDEILLSDSDLLKAIDLVQDIDENDTMFVALNNHLHSILWTGDKKLAKGLNNKGYNKVITTDELYSIFLDKKFKNKK